MECNCATEEQQAAHYCPATGTATPHSSLVKQTKNLLSNNTVVVEVAVYIRLAVSSLRRRRRRLLPVARHVKMSLECNGMAAAELMWLGRGWCSSALALAPPWEAAANAMRLRLLRAIDSTGAEVRRLR